MNGRRSQADARQAKRKYHSVANDPEAPLPQQGEKMTFERVSRIDEYFQYRKLQRGGNGFGISAEDVGKGLLDTHNAIAELASELNGEDDIFSQLQKVVTSVAALTASVSTKADLAALTASVSTKADLAALTTKVDTLTANLDGLQQQLTQTQQLLAAAQTNAGLRSMNVWAQPSGNNGLELQQLVVEDAPGGANEPAIGSAFAGGHGLYPSNVPELRQLTAAQLDGLEAAYNRRFAGADVDERRSEFARFVGARVVDVVITTTNVQRQTM